MKFLAAFWLALAVVAVDKTASDWLLEVTTGNSVSGLKDLFGKFGCEICEAVDPESVFHLVRYCLEAGESLLPENLLEVDAVHVAAFIFMLRAQGKEGAAECLYNAVMNARFSAQFQSKFYQWPYTLEALANFEKLAKKDDKQFFMLWVVQMHDKRQEQESEDERQKRLLRCSENVVRALVVMGFPPDLQLERMVRLPRKFSASNKLCLLTSFQLMLISFTESEYSKLGEPEQVQLRAFLERYLKFEWNDRIVPAERLSWQEFKQFKEAFDLEGCMRGSDFMPLNTNDLVRYLCLHVKLRCPAFLLKKKVDFYSREELLDETIRDRKYRLLRALMEAREIVGKEQCQDKELACSQIGRAIDECNEEIDGFFENPKARAEWEKTLSEGLGTEFKEKSREACADLKLPN